MIASLLRQTDRQALVFPFVGFAWKLASGIRPKIRILCRENKLLTSIFLKHPAKPTRRSRACPPKLTMRMADLGPLTAHFLRLFRNSSLKCLKVSCFVYSSRIFQTWISRHSNHLIPPPWPKPQFALVAHAHAWRSLAVRGSGADGKGTDSNISPWYLAQKIASIVHENECELEVYINKVQKQNCSVEWLNARSVWNGSTKHVKAFLYTIFSTTRSSISLKSWPPVSRYCRVIIVFEKQQKKWIT